MVQPTSLDEFQAKINAIEASLIGPPTLWDKMGQAIREDRLDDARADLQRYGLPPKPASRPGLNWALLDRQLHLLHDPTLNVDDLVSVPPAQGMHGFLSCSATPLHGTILLNQPRLRAWLLERGARLDVPNDQGQTVWDLVNHLGSRFKGLALPPESARMPGAVTAEHAKRQKKTTEALREELIRAEQARLRAAMDPAHEALLQPPFGPSSRSRL